ncbi:MAG: hypothetical protein CR986_01790 [Ignavibacteriae bacterium]|nr:MAG: hypothetical protein CR986_01790 [Ignavibacteriota bacterium]
MLLAFVLFFLFIKGRIKEKEFVLLFYVLTPIAVVTQFLMTYIRDVHHSSNLPVMNTYLIIEFILLVYILLNIKQKIKGEKINYKLWGILVLLVTLSHFIYKFKAIHSASFLLMALIYFQITVNFADIDNIKKFLFNHYTFVYIAVFLKAIGYSYFLIYQIDYKFPLSIYSILNILVQFFFILTLIYYYNGNKEKII